jgi:hypothetical protein
MTDYTEQERRTIRSGAYGAVALVSDANPGAFDVFKEAIAGARARLETSQELRELLRSGGVPRIPQGSPAEVESTVLTALRESTSILEAKNPAELDGFRNVVATACDKAAHAAGTVPEDEDDTVAVGKVKQALGAP